MICTASHNIEIANLSNGERVNHSILLIKGNVRARCSTPDSATADKLCVELHCVTVDDNEQSLRAITVARKSSTSVIAGGGEFKFLLDWETLPAGEYNLQFHCCNCRCEVRRIQYNPLPQSAYRLQPLYIVCSDEQLSSDVAEPAAATEELHHACDERLAKINLNLRLVQCVYADKIRAAGFGRRTFTLNGRCRIHRTQLQRAQAWRLTEHELWEYFAAELLNDPSWRSQQERVQLKFAAFIACTRYNGAELVASGDRTYANIRRHLQAHAALGGGGLALFGSAHFYAWPRHFAQIIACLDSTKEVDLSRQPDESNYRRTHGGVYATTLGAICHELGHTFDLGHSSEGVMGDGFDYLNRVLTVAAATEHLPARLFRPADTQGSELERGSSVGIAGPRLKFTQLKRPAGQTFLDKYREQRENDSFYFTRNCAIILAHHKWLRDDAVAETPSTPGDPDLRLEQLNGQTHIISTGRAPLKIVELRSNDNSLVSQFYEFQKSDTDAPVFKFQLPAGPHESQHIFAMTASGAARRFD